MKTCIQCAVPIAAERRNGRPRRFCSDVCNRRWRKVHPHEPLPVQEGGAKWDALPDRPASPRELGPHVPLNGLDDVAVRRERNARILRAIRDGVEIDALSERFGLSTEALYQIASRARVSINTSRLAYGVLAP